MLEDTLLVGFEVSRDGEARLQHVLRVRCWSVLGDYAQVLLVVRVTPGVGHPRRTDYPLSGLVVPLLASDAGSQGTREDLVPLLLAGMDMLGHREAWRKNNFDAQQIAVCLRGGFEEGHPRPQRGVLYDVSWLGHALLSFHSLFPARNSPTSAANRSALSSISRWPV